MGGRAAESRACPAPHRSRVLVALCRVTKRPRLVYSAHECAADAGLGTSLKASDGAAWPGALKLGLPAALPVRPGLPQNRCQGLQGGCPQESQGATVPAFVSQPRKSERHVAMRGLRHPHTQAGTKTPPLGSGVLRLWKGWLGGKAAFRPFVGPQSAPAGTQGSAAERTRGCPRSELPQEAGPAQSCAPLPLQANGSPG